MYTSEHCLTVKQKVCTVYDLAILFLATFYRHNPMHVMHAHMHQETCPRILPSALLVESPKQEQLNSRTDKQMEWIHTILYSMKMNELPLHTAA